MADENTHADSLRVHLSGASSHDGAQTDPVASIGNYRSSTEAEMLAISTASLPANLTVDFAAGANGVGSGSLACPTADTIAWTPPGGSQGPAVTILNGETKVVEGGGGDLGKYLRVSRTSAAALAGTATVTLADVVNNAVGLDNVSSTEAGAGDDEQRGLFLVNGSAAAITDLKLWITTIGTARASGGSQLGASGAGTIAVAAGDFDDWDGDEGAGGFCRIETAAGALREIVYYSSRTATELTVPAAGREMLGTSAAAGASDDVIYCVPGIRLALESPSDPTNGYIDDSADEGTIPGGLTWYADIAAGDNLLLASLDAGDQHGLRIRREVPVGMIAAPLRLNCFEYSFDAA